MWLVSRLRQLDHNAFPCPASDWRWSSITVNRGYLAARHVDANNHGPSVIRSVASAEDRLWFWPHGDKRTLQTLPQSDAIEVPISSRRHLWSFDGRCPHEVKPYKGNVANRLSVIFFQAARGWKASDDTTARLVDLGFVPASTLEDAATFDSRFALLTGDSSYASWQLTST